MNKNWKVEKQHFVPKFILKNFAINNKQIWIFDKLHESSHLASVRDTASQNNFYKFEKEDSKLNTEDALSSLESDCAPIIMKIIKTTSIKDINDNEHSLICLFVAIQYLRTERPRETITQTIDLLGRKLAKDGLDFGEEEISKMKSEIKDIAVLSLFNLSFEVMKDLKLKMFALFVAPPNFNFIISDNPVTLYNHKPRHGHGDLGTRVKYIDIYFPISPKHCLIFTCPSLVNEMNESIMKNNLYRELDDPRIIDLRNFEYVVKSYNYKTPMILSEEIILFHNSLQIFNSTRFIYSFENNFVLAREMISENGSLKCAPQLQSN